MSGLLDELRYSLRDARLKSLERSIDGLTFFIWGSDGEAEISFGDQGILGCVEADLVHYWYIPESISGIRSAVQKIRDMIG